MAPAAIHLVVKMRPGREPGGSDIADHLTALDALPAAERQGVNDMHVLDYLVLIGYFIGMASIGFSRPGPLSWRPS